MEMDVWIGDKRKDTKHSITYGFSNGQRSKKIKPIEVIKAEIESYISQHKIITIRKGKHLSLIHI